MAFLSNQLRTCRVLYRKCSKSLKQKTLVSSHPVCSNSISTIELPFTEDRYGGLYVRLTDVSIDQFRNTLCENMSQWKKSGCTAVWLEVPITQSALIPMAAEQGFAYHHAEGDTAVLCQWMEPSLPSLLPRYATHQVGVAGCVVRKDTRQILLIKERNRKYTVWKFPGGLSELGEDISATAMREVFEETGIKSKFEGILTFRQSHNQSGAFGRSDLYFLCHLTPLTFDLKPCDHEVLECEWMNVEDILRDPAHHNGVTLQVTHLVRKGMEEGFDHVDLRGHEFKSIFKGRKYLMYSRPVDAKIDNYLVGVTDDSLLKTGSPKS